jgi:hypothetical protein
VFTVILGKSFSLAGKFDLFAFIVDQLTEFSELSWEAG